MKKIAIAGLMTLLTAHLLQLGYKVADFYPPNHVFYFAIGSTAYLLTKASEKILNA